MAGKVQVFSKASAAFLAFSLIFCAGFPAQAEEYSSGPDSGEENYGNQDQGGAYWDYDSNKSYDSYDNREAYDSYAYDDYDESYEGDSPYEDDSNWIVIEEPEEEPGEESGEPSDPGTYTVAPGWSPDRAAKTEDTVVYRQDSRSEEEESSTISCSYLETNYSVQEYEQLRDMLTNNLLYENVNAQITTSAVYTLAKDYLYIIAVDDPARDYRNIYHYVVGDYLCFCVQVKEYRSESEENTALDQQTPQQAGQSIAESFIWN